MTKEGTDASFASELLGGVPEAFVHTALLAGGVGLWEWPVVSDRMALSPYLETLLGYPSGGFDGTKSSFLARLMLLDRPRFELCAGRCDRTWRRVRRRVPRVRHSRRLAATSWRRGA